MEAVSPRRRPPLSVVVTLARSTVIEQLNRRSLWWIAGIALALVCGLALIGSFVTLSDLTPKQVATLFSEGAARYYVLIVLVIQGLSLVRADADSGVAGLILSRPVSRLEYVLGRYAGNAVGLVGTIAIMGLGCWAVLLVKGFVDWTILYEFAVLAFNACVFLALIMLLGTLVGTIGSVAIGGICYYALGSGTTYLMAAAIDGGAIGGPGAALMRLAIFLLPHVVASPTSAAQAMQLGGSTLTLSGPTVPDALWSLAWVAGCLALTVVQLGRREL